MENDIKYLDAMEKIISMRTKLDSLCKRLIAAYNKVNILDLDADYISSLKTIIFSIVVSVDQISETLWKASVCLMKKDTDIAYLLDALKQTNDDLENLIPETYIFLESIDNL